MLTSSAVTLLTISTTVGSLEPVARALVPALVSYALRSTLVLAAAWIVAVLLRGSAAATRHAVWAVAITTVAVLPLLSRAAPPIDIPVRALPSITPAVPVAPARPVRRTLAPASARASAALASHRVTTTVLPDLRHVSSHPEPIPTTPDLSLLIVAVWMLGTICLVIRFVVGTMVVWQRALMAESVSETEWVMLARGVARELGIRRPVTLLMTRVRTIPVTWGIIYPVVLLPVQAADWSPGRRRAVLLHELAHVARFDAATQLLGRLVLAATWFNPLTWLAVRHMRTERERACDDVVLRRGTQASTYATDLLTIVRTLQSAGEPGFAALAMARHAELEGRLLFILDARRRRETLSARRSMLSLAAAAPFIVLVAAIRPSARAVRPVSALASVPITSTVVPEVAPAPSAVQSASSQAAHLTRVAPPLPPAPPATFRAISEGPMSVPLGATVSALPTPSRSAASPTRCPIQTEFASGGVSADRGQVASLELENDDHRVLAVASDGRCVTGRLDGWVILSDDEANVTGLGTDAHLTIADSVGGHVRRAEVSRVISTGHTRGRLSAATEPGFYVFDGFIVDGVPLKPNGPATDDSLTTGYHLTTNPDDIGKLEGVGDSRIWIAQLGNSGAAETRMGTVRNTVERDSVGVEANSVGGVLAYQYFVDGRSRSWSEGDEWFRTTLMQLVRETGYNVHSRVAFLRAGGGVPAVVGEIRQVRSDMGLRAYFDALLATGNLSPDDAAQALSVAQSMLTEASDRDRIVAQLKTQAGRLSRSTSVHVF